MSHCIYLRVPRRAACHETSPRGFSPQRRALLARCSPIRGAESGRSPAAARFTMHRAVRMRMALLIALCEPSHLADAMSSPTWQARSSVCKPLRLVPHARTRLLLASSAGSVCILSTNRLSCYPRLLLPARALHHAGQSSNLACFRVITSPRS